MTGTFFEGGDAAKAVSKSEVEKLRAKIGQLVVEREFLAKAGMWRRSNSSLTVEHHQRLVAELMHAQCGRCQAD